MARQEIEKALIRFSYASLLVLAPVIACAPPKCVGEIPVENFRGSMDAATKALRYSPEQDFRPIGRQSLGGRKPATFPNGIEVRRNIRVVLPQIESLELREKLTEIHDLLPDQDEIKIYNNELVDDNTFEEQRRSLDEVRSKAITQARPCPQP